MSSSDATQISRESGSPRTPLADITPLVLAAGSPFTSPASNVADMKSRPLKRSAYSGSDLTGAIDMLTADDAKQLLLLSAQSNVSLAHAIREIAASRASKLSINEMQQSYLADTFIFDERYLMENLQSTGI